MDLGWKFWLGLVGVCLAAGIVVTILFIVIGWAWYACQHIGSWVFMTGFSQSTQRVAQP